MKRLLTAAEVAEALGRPTAWVLRSAASGALPSFKVGKAVRFDEDDIDAWLERQRRGEKLASPNQLHAIGGTK